MAAHGRFIDVEVEEHDAIPEGCELRFHAIGETRTVEHIRYEPLTGPEATFVVTAAGGGPAQATPVDDSSAGSAVLVTGDHRGLRLRPLEAAGGPTLAEPYLLLSADALVD